MNYVSISNIKAKTIRRMPTGQDELDWLYGVSKFPGSEVWGMPIGTISTWVGEKGVGKSRLAINVAKNMVRIGKKVLYFQNEVDLPTLASWVNDDSLENFFCSEETSLVQQANIISYLRPDLVFVDSINLIDEFGTGTAKSIKVIIDSLRKVIRNTDCHIVVLCQLNKEGSATGSTALGHLPDVNINLTNTDEDGIFKIGIGKKNRYGRTGSTYHGLWRHIETGVECISTNRFADDRWKPIIDFGTHKANTESKVPSIDDGIPDLPGQITVDDGIPDIDDPISYVNDPVPVLGPRLVENTPATLETCSPAVKEAYHMLISDKEPNKEHTSIKRFIKFVKNNWGFK